MKKNLFALFIALLSVGQVFGGHGGPHYGRVTISSSSEAGGKVYLTDKKDKDPSSITDEEWLTTYTIDWDCSTTSNVDSMTYYAYAKANTGYLFAGWDASKTATTFASAETIESGYVIVSKTTSDYSKKDNPKTTTKYAIFQKGSRFYATQTIQAKVKDDGVNSNGSGKVFINTANNQTAADWQSSSTILNNKIADAASAKVTFYAFALADEGTFYGWYDGTGKFISSNNPYTISVTSSSTDPSNPTQGGALYAYFRTTTDTKYGRAIVNVQTSSQANGLVYASATNLSWKEISNEIRTKFSAPCTSIVNSTLAQTYSVSMPYYIYAVPKRGFKLNSWSTSAAGTASTSTGWRASDVANPLTYSFTVTSTDESKPTDGKSCYAMFAANSSTCDIKYKKPSNGNFTVQCLDVEDNAIVYQNILSTDTVPTEKSISHYTSDVAVLTAQPADGYKVYRWVSYDANGAVASVLTYGQNEYVFITSSAQTIGVEFIPTNENFMIKESGEHCTTLQDAIDKATAYVGSHSGATIVPLMDYTVPAGNYTIPQGVTLLIPFDEKNTYNADEPYAWHGHHDINSDGSYKGKTTFTTSNHDHNYDRAELYRKLTLAENVHLEINGTLNVAADHWVIYATGKDGNDNYTGLPNISGNFRIDQKYGMIDMNTNSSIVINNGGKLQCWGRIRGEGTITAKSGSEVRECFVFTDHRDEDKLGEYARDTKCFPMHQNYIQDIQVSITYESGSKCMLVSGVFGTSKTETQTGKMNFVGNAGDKTNPSFIELKDGSSFTKKYDVKTDHLILDLRDGASFNNFKLSVTKLKGTAASTETHIFTVNNNWKINIISGETHIAHDLAFAAGAELNINTGASVVVDDNASIYIYDKDDWGAYSTGKTIIPLFLPEYELDNQTTSYADVTLYDFTASSKYKVIRRAEDLEDASIKVNGTLIIKGGTNAIYSGTSYGNKYKVTQASGLYTTTEGANIYSEGNGQIIYEQGAGTQDHIHQQIKYASEVEEVHIDPAKLKNADDIEQYTPTAGATGKSTFKYFGTGEKGKWKKVSKVTFKDDGTTIKEDSVAQGDAINAPADPQKEGYTFKGWDKEVVGQVMGTEDLVYEAQWEQIVIEATTIEVTPTEVIKDDVPETSITENTYTIYEKVEADTVKVDEGAAIEITENASVETQTLALSTTPSAINLPDEGQSAIGTSSQIKGNGTITAQNVFIDITMDPSGTLDASKYYAFAVPFAVKVDGGVQQFNDNEWVDCKHDTHYRAYTYDGAKRADNGKGSNWTLVDNKGTFQPGVFYLVEFAPGMGNVYRFTKATEGNLNNAANIDLEEFAGANTADIGWNGIANNALQNASISVNGIDEGVAQVFDPAQNAFVTVGLAGTQFAIGTPLFVQVGEAGTATNSAATQPASAPAQILAQPQTETLGNYIVRIAAENANKMADQLFISASEDAENNYVIGKDLVKMFMGNATTAQLWVNNYDKKLSMHQALLANGSAEASLTLFAPKAGNYRVYLKEAPEDATIYLMENGCVVANLNDDAYYVALTKGENSLYGLRINAKTKADVTTSINNLNANSSVQKVLFQNKVYIVRNGRLFDIFGQTVK